MHVNCAEDESNAFFSKHERLLNLCLLELEGEVMSPCWGFGYMDGLGRLPSFIKCGHWTQPDDKLILQKKRGGRPTTSLDFQSHKSPPSAAALKATSTSQAAPQQGRRPKVTSNSHGHYKWVMQRCKNILSADTVGHTQLSYDKCARFKCNIIYKWNTLQLKSHPAWCVGLFQFCKRAERWWENHEEK